jgi:Orsellinic acid/F9775 biosynthesis cluster protein D
MATMRPVFKQLSEFGLLVCTTDSCGHAVWPDQIMAHCKGKQHKMATKEAVEIADAFRNEAGLKRHSDELQMPRSARQAIAQLPIYTDGLICTLEPGVCRYICRNRRNMGDHCRVKHGWKSHSGSGRPKKAPAAAAVTITSGGESSTRNEDRQAWRAIHCQRFFVQGAGSQYFEVVVQTHREDGESADTADIATASLGNPQEAGDSQGEKGFM